MTAADLYESPDGSIRKRVDAATRRALRGTVSITIDCVGGPGIGSGALVRLGNRLFVLTAAHNLWDDQANEAPYVFVANAPPKVFVEPRLPLRSFVPVSADPSTVEPDVAVLELDEQTPLRTDSEPFGEDDIGFLSGDGDLRACVLAGFPAARRIKHEPERIDGIGTRWPMELRAVGLSCFTIPNQRSASEPKEGRGVHVFFSDLSAPDENGVVHPIPHASGMSGGPLMTGKDGKLVGLARSRADFRGGTDEWCEPAVEAIRGLVGHDDPEVAAAAARVVARCDAERAASLDTSKY